MKKPDLIIGEPPYLKRWFITKWSDDSHWMKRLRLPNIYLHQMLRSDAERELHDHPWSNLSIVLWGGYIEHTFAYTPTEGAPLPPVIRKRRRPGSIVFRSAELAHKLELRRRCGAGGPGSVNDIFYGEDVPCWTLFFTWRKRREWGFWCEEKSIVGTHEVTRTEPAESDRPGKKTVIELRSYGMVGKWVHQQIFESVRQMYAAAAAKINPQEWQLTQQDLMVFGTGVGFIDKDGNYKHVDYDPKDERFK